ncbi:MAG: VOC family protein [Bacteroidota bacterium]
MKNPIYPCLWFDGKAKEAAELYGSVFHHAKIITDTPMVVEFELCGKKFMGLNGGPVFKVNPSVSFFVLFPTVEETNTAWNKLIDGGKALIPIGKQPWSEWYGWLEDKFGVTWQLAINDKPAGQQTLTPCLLYTGNKFGKAEEAVQFYTKLFQNSAVDLMICYPQDDPNAGKVMYSEFNLDGYKMIAMDGPGEHKHSFNEGVSFVLICHNQQEIDFFWNTLTKDGGAESMCGWLVDKFGLWWQIIPAKLGQLMTQPGKGQNVMKELMKMKKIDLQVLEEA